MQVCHRLGHSLNVLRGGEGREGGKQREERKWREKARKEKTKAKPKKKKKKAKHRSFRMRDAIGQMAKNSFDSNHSKSPLILNPPPLLIPQAWKK